MRIALITDGIWPYVMGGMQKHSYYLCKYLAKNKVNVDLIHFNNSSYDISLLENFSEAEKEYIRSICVDMPQSLKFPGHYIYNSYRHSVRIFDRIKGDLSAYDFIYTKGFTGWHLINQKQKGAIDCCKIGVNFHGYEMFQRAPDFKTKLQHIFLLQKPVRKLNIKADVVFSYGGKITNIIKSIGVDPKKIFELASGIEADSLVSNVNPTQNLIRFLYLGRYERRKGIEELTKALQLLLNEQVAKFEFHFIGNIPENKRIKNSSIIYHEEIRDKKNLQDKINACDVLICPSYSEGFPNVILEAMGSGLAIAATPVGAVELMVDNTNGWIIESSSEHSILAVLRIILKENKILLDEKKKASLEKIKSDFLWDKLAKKLILALEKQNLDIPKI